MLPKIQEIAKQAQVEDLKVLTGNELQHVTHRQILETGNLIMESKDLTPDLKNLGMDFVLTSAQFNKNGNAIKAGGFVDFCGALAETAKNMAVEFY